MNTQPWQRNHWPALTIVAAFVLLALSYARATPPFEAADEAPHFLYVHNLLADRALPQIVSRAEVAEETDPTRLWAIENHQPPLYYALGALLVSGFQRDDLPALLRSNDVIFIRGVVAHNPNKWLHSPHAGDGDTLAALWTLRLFSIALSVFTLWLVYLTARLIFPGSNLPLQALLLVAGIPTFAAIGGSVNNDNLVTLLYSAGVYLSLRSWRARALSPRLAAGLCAVLALAPLAKLTGASLFGVVFAALMAGAWRGYYPWRQALTVMVAALLAAAVVSGWWFVRNWSLYGDPLALAATQSLWGREFEMAATSGDPLAEAARIGRSFWFMVGHLHQPVYGPRWFELVAGALTALGIGGALWAGLRQRSQLSDFQRDSLLLLAGVCGLVIAVLVAGTRSVDISYGRLLFPALTGFAPLLIFGWRQIAGRAAPLLVLPLLAMALLGPLRVADAYRPLQVLDAHTSAPADTLIITNAETLVAQVAPGEAIEIVLTFSGNDPDNPALGVNAIDSLTRERLGRVELYPGMAPTDALEPDRRYRARLSLPLDDSPQSLSPRVVDLQFEWFIPATNELVSERVLLPGPVLIDARYRPPDLPGVAGVTFGDAVRLDGFELPAEVSPGETLPVALRWHVLEALSDDIVAAVQLIDESGTIIAQADGPPDGYPPRAWVADTAFIDTRAIAIPADAPAGTYRLLIGWYRRADASRLQAVGDASIAHDLLELPVGIEIAPE